MSRDRSTICMLMPYFGEWPEWFPLYLCSCKRNPSVNWVFFSDNPVPACHPNNVSFVYMSWDDCSTLVASVCGVDEVMKMPYKLCDYRFAYGDIFSKYIEGYDFFGFGDIDVIYGDLRRFLTENVLSHDLATFSARHVTGHFTLLRNKKSVVEKYKRSPVWREWIGHEDVVALDENAGYYGIKNVYSVEAYATPLSPFTPWLSGAYDFPSEWYFKDGVLSNNIDQDRQFMYLHFMRYKLRWVVEDVKRIVHFDPTVKCCDWKLCVDGFYRLLRDPKASGYGETLPPYDVKSSNSFLPLT